MQKQINIQNKKAKYEYSFIQNYTAGIVLTGSEIKSIRNGEASINNSFCEFNDRQELFIINMQINKYSASSIFNHNPKASRKLLLKKNELKKLSKEVKSNGLTIIPIKLYINEKGIAKLLISLAKGKKLYDKRVNIKNREIKRDLDRLNKSFKNKN
ncbi:MAG: SsrA-binding protein [Flavobacteriaceae bacterium]|nr:SsrA-binding protein [Flavobacteriaceae bacterium]